MFELAVVIIVAALNSLLGYVVYTKNPKSATNRLFFGLTLAFVLWSIVNYVSVNPYGLSQLAWIRLVLFFAALLCLLVYLTFTVFPATNIKKPWRTFRPAIISTVLVMLLTQSPLVFKSLKIDGDKVSPQPGPAIPIFALLVFCLLSRGIWNLFYKYRHSKGRERMQLRYIILGLAGTFSLLFLSNFVLVVALGITLFVPLGPAFTLIFTGAFTYAIIRHKLFDIRRAAARGVAYILTIGFLAAVYSLLVIGVTSLLFSSKKLDKDIQITYTLLAILLAFTFQRSKDFFDRISNRIFFKGQYDPQQFLDDLNQVLVTQAELRPLLTNSIAIIENNLRAERSSFIIRETAYFPLRTIGPKEAVLSEHDIKHLHTQIINVPSKVIVADYLSDNHSALRSSLNAKNIAVVVRLTVNLANKNSGVGEIIIGPKKSGDPYSSEDIRILDIIANELVIAVQNALRFEEIENFNITLQQKVNEATRKLRNVNERLKALDETKDDFISMASHQLRTPLTSVKGYLSMVLEGDAGKVTPTQKDMLGQAFTSSQRMVYLIADLLNVSRLKTGKFILEKTSVNLADMIEQELAQVEETAKSRQITLRYEKPKNFPNLMLDDTKTRQVIMNFTDNAIYYTQAKGHVDIKLIEKPSTIELRIIDNGIGVPRSEQHHLFTKFYRAGNARKARPDGTGLGLFMAKKVVAAQGGSIIFESTPGKGSTFGFLFSKNALMPPEGAPDHISTPTELAVKQAESQK